MDSRPCVPTYHAIANLPILKRRAVARARDVLQSTCVSGNHLNERNPTDAARLDCVPSNSHPQGIGQHSLILRQWELLFTPPKICSEISKKKCRGWPRHDRCAPRMARLPASRSNRRLDCTRSRQTVDRCRDFKKSKSGIQVSRSQRARGHQIRDRRVRVHSLASSRERVF